MLLAVVLLPDIERGMMVRHELPPGIGGGKVGIDPPLQCGVRGINIDVGVQAEKVSVSARL